MLLPPVDERPVPLLANECVEKRVEEPGDRAFTRDRVLSHFSCTCRVDRRDLAQDGVEDHVVRRVPSQCFELVDPDTPTIDDHLPVVSLRQCAAVPSAAFAAL